MRRVIGVGFAVVLLSVTLGLGTSQAAGLPLTLVKDGFNEPIYVTNAGDSRLFVVQQDGLVKIIHKNGSVSTFLDISSLILHDDERGLFSIAFHPNYATNGLFYVDYTRAGDGASTVEEFKVSTDADVADPTSGRVVLVVPEPYSGHNGGWMGFIGKYLYVTVGDGGSTEDSLGYGQNTSVLNGKIVRIDPRDPDGAGPRSYSIPRTNPFVGRNGADEIWSWGLRNTWRCSFDKPTNNLWCGDVGAGLFEEVDRVTLRNSGYNFGWSLIEGHHYFNDPPHVHGTLCTTGCKTLPIIEYPHTTSDCGGAVVGGYVSRRSGAVMNGKYVFGDFCSGDIWEISATFKAGKALPGPVGNVGAGALDSFGQGADGRLYLVERNGSIYRLDQS